MATAELQQLDFHLAKPERHFSGEGHRGPSHAGGHGLNTREETRETTNFAGLVLLTTLNNQIVRVLARKDVICPVCASTKHAHSVVVRQNDVLDRLVGHLANTTDDVLGHGGGSLRVSHKHCIVANDDAGVGIAFCCIGPRVFRYLAKGDLLLFKVGLRSKLLSFLAHGIFLLKWVYDGQCEPRYAALTLGSLRSALPVPSKVM